MTGGSRFSRRWFIGGTASFGAQRYALEVKGPVAEGEIGLHFNWGDPSRIRFERIRIERLA